MDNQLVVVDNSDYPHSALHSNGRLDENNFHASNGRSSERDSLTGSAADKIREPYSQPVPCTATTPIPRWPEISLHTLTISARLHNRLLIGLSTVKGRTFGPSANTSVCSTGCTFTPMHTAPHHTVETSQLRVDILEIRPACRGGEAIQAIAGSRAPCSCSFAVNFSLRAVRRDRRPDKCQWCEP